jgi:hypothetical protein
MKHKKLSRMRCPLRLAIHQHQLRQQCACASQPAVVQGKVAALDEQCLVCACLELVCLLCEAGENGRGDEAA